MLVKVIVIFGCNFPHLGQVAPGNSNEIVVLVVVSDVECERVNDSVVGIGFLRSENSPMLSNPSGTKRVEQKSHTQQR